MCEVVVSLVSLASIPLLTLPLFLAVTLRRDIFKVPQLSWHLMATDEQRCWLEPHLLFWGHVEATPLCPQPGHLAVLTQCLP